MLLSCICLDEEEELRTEERPTAVYESTLPPTPPPQQQQTDRYREDSKEIQRERKKLRDKVTIFTGALGSRDECDDEEGEEDDFSEDGFEYQEDGLFDSAGDREINWTWPRNYQPLDEVLKDKKKIDMITEVQRRIGVAPKNYMKMAKSTNFSLDKCTICRYLEANLWEVGNVDERIMETIEWRVSFGLPSIEQSLLRTELETGKFFCHGYSLDGRPVVYLLLGKENTWSADGNTAAVIYTLERAIASMQKEGQEAAAGGGGGGHVQEAVYIIDCEGVGLTTAPATAFVSQLIGVLGKHYPRRMGQIFICNVSSVFYFIWNVVSLSLAEMTAKKIQILTSDIADMRARIGEFVPLADLHAKFGGEADFVFHVDSYLRQHRKLLK